MSEIICLENAHRAGFNLSVGNWIAPNGGLICGESDSDHHFETAKKYCKPEQIDNQLYWMNSLVQDGYIRLVFRADILFQVGCSNVDDIWSDSPNYMRMIDILRRIPGVEIHIFSSRFYLIGKSEEIVKRDFQQLQLKQC